MDEKAKQEIATHAVNMTEIAMGAAAVSMSLAETPRTPRQKADAAHREYEALRQRLAEEMGRHLRAIEPYMAAVLVGISRESVERIPAPVVRPMDEWLSDGYRMALTEASGKWRAYPYRDSPGRKGVGATGWCESSVGARRAANRLADADRKAAAASGEWVGGDAPWRGALAIPANIPRPTYRCVCGADVPAGRSCSCALGEG